MQKTLSDVDNLEWHELNHIIVETAKQVFGQTSGRTHIEKETWWWKE